MADFLLELLCEEIPARMQKGARGELEKLFRQELDAAGVGSDTIIVWSTPRRLALIARGLPLETKAVREEAKGPPVGAPDQAVDGFCRKNGVTRDQLEEREIKGRATWFAVKDVPGQAVSDLLAAAIPAIIRDFSWPKSMRWGEASLSSESLKWVRPLTGIVALLDGEVVPVVMEGLASGRETVGHRFHSSGPITIKGADDYADALAAAHVIVEHEKREALVRDGARRAAENAGLTLVEDEGLVVENAGLTEWPVPLLGRFDEEYLDVPPEVIQLTARVNQKYFVCEDANGKLANAFVCTANLASSAPNVVVDGNRKVIAARLSDARFFWELDQKTTLAEHAEGLKRITFHESIGTVKEKSERIAEISTIFSIAIAKANLDAATKDGSSDQERSLAAQEYALATQARNSDQSKLKKGAFDAGLLCKADLVTEMVGEFPELQGIMGGYYAGAEGLGVEIATAIREHYLPAGASDNLPSSDIGIAVSAADKLDTLAQFFSIGETPTGSKDPFALRRAAIGLIRLITEKRLRVPLKKAIELAYHSQAKVIVRRARDKVRLNAEAGRTKPETKATPAKTINTEVSEPTEPTAYDKLLDFFADRLKVQQREAGVRHDIIDAVFAQGDEAEDDLVRLLDRVKALQAFVETENGANLLAGYKRAANILKKEGILSPEEIRGPRKPWVPAGLVPGIGTPKAQATVSSETEARDPLSYTPEVDEKALIDALDAAQPKAAAAIEAEDFESAMEALASLRSAVDAFFDNVVVNAPEADKRASRLALLARFRDAVHQVADFSRIEG